MKTFISAILILLPFYSGAQDVFPELVTDRPDQTESSVVVPPKSLQVETGFLKEKDKSDYLKHESFAYNSTLLRYGLFQNMELRLGLEYLGDKTRISGTDSITVTSGFSPLYTGFKIKISEEQDWRPAIAFLGGLVLPFTANKIYKPEHSAADMRFSFSHTLSNRFSLGYNLGVEWDGETPVPGYYYTFSIGSNISESLGAFIESYGSIPEKGEQEHLADAGFTYLLLPNLQLDVSGGIGLYNALDNFIGIGLTYRIPK